MRMLVGSSDVRLVSSLKLALMIAIPRCHNDRIVRSTAEMLRVWGENRGAVVYDLRRGPMLRSSSAATQ
ncbi:MAG: hypothetical protein RLZ81_1213 [Pseudomonadota bacterium]|jgi:hypothetical protein